ncbi:hypothetical protein AAHA92_14582 [Salvia divinorum]|uniref:Uncharacterized protein n=1 Tax=Salvia divinorum TaxID=28513 RepID=A0ABD1HC22_SALDI
MASRRCREEDYVAWTRDIRLGILLYLEAIKNCSISSRLCINYSDLKNPDLERRFRFSTAKRKRNNYGCFGFSFRSAQRFLQGQHPPRQALPQARSERIHQGRDSNGDRLRRDGFRRIFRQVDFHSHQQHYRRRSLITSGWYKNNATSQAWQFITWTHLANFVALFYLVADSYVIFTWSHMKNLEFYS